MATASVSGGSGGAPEIGRGREAREEQWGLEACTDGRKKNRGKEGSSNGRCGPFILARRCGGQPEKGRHVTGEEGGSLARQRRREAGTSPGTAGVR
jgi:hypothetical protein